MDAITYVGRLFKESREFLEGTLADVTPEQAHWSPAGTALPIAAHYAHVVTSIDGFILGVLKGGAPLFASTWAGKTGLSEIPPGGGGPGPWGEGAGKGRVER